MNIKQKIIAVLLVCGGQACIAQAIAPEVIASAGDNYSNSQGSLNWTLGEPIIATENSNNYYLTQGFQQPATIIVTAINSTSGQGSLNVYPNPFAGSVYIQRDGGKRLQVQLTDMNGKIVMNKILSPSENQLELSTLANGVYLLNVYDSENQLMQSLKIEKVK
jgi:hypothetical protein